VYCTSLTGEVSDDMSDGDFDEVRHRGQYPVGIIGDDTAALTTHAAAGPTVHVVVQRRTSIRQLTVDDDCRRLGR